MVGHYLRYIILSGFLVTSLSQASASSGLGPEYAEFTATAAWDNTTQNQIEIEALRLQVDFSSEVVQLALTDGISQVHEFDDYIYENPSGRVRWVRYKLNERVDQAMPVSSYIDRMRKALHVKNVFDMLNKARLELDQLQMARSSVVGGEDLADELAKDIFKLTNTSLYGIHMTQFGDGGVIMTGTDISLVYDFLSDVRTQISKFGLLNQNKMTSRSFFKALNQELKSVVTINDANFSELMKDTLYRMSNKNSRYPMNPMILSARRLKLSLLDDCKYFLSRLVGHMRKR